MVLPLQAGVLSVGRQKKFWSISLSTALRFGTCVTTLFSLSEGGWVCPYLVRAVNGLGSAPSQEKRSKVVAGSSPVLVVSNLD